VTERATFTVKEAAIYSGIGMNHMYNLCNQPDFPVIKLSPRRFIIPKAKLDEWLMKQADKK